MPASPPATRSAEASAASIARRPPAVWHPAVARWRRREGTAGDISRHQSCCHGKQHTPCMSGCLLLLPAARTSIAVRCSHDSSSLHSGIAYSPSRAAQQRACFPPFALPRRKVEEQQSFPPLPRLRRQRRPCSVNHAASSPPGGRCGSEPILVRSCVIDDGATQTQAPLSPHKRSRTDAAHHGSMH